MDLNIKDHPEANGRDLSFEDKDSDESTYDTDQNHDGDNDGDADDDQNIDPSFSLTDEETKENFKRLESKYDEETWIEIIENSKRWKFTTIQNRYRKIHDRQEIYRMKKYLQKGGTIFKKWEKINEIVFKEYTKWKEEESKIVHDRDIVVAALAAANRIGLTDFKASEHWLLRFKKEHGISTRKATNVET